jgi:hypothetical protein
MFSVPLRPRKAYRRAEEDTREYKGNHRGQVECDDTKYEAAESLVGEDL